MNEMSALINRKIVVIDGKFLHGNKSAIYMMSPQEAKINEC